MRRGRACPAPAAASLTCGSMHKRWRWSKVGVGSHNIAGQLQGMQVHACCRQKIRSRKQPLLRLLTWHYDMVAESDRIWDLCSFE